jgi:hypothetical protein
MLSVNEKIYFWSGIMKDHSDFILTNLSSKEIELIKNAKYFKDEFSEIHTSSKENTTEEFINKVTSLLSSFIDFKIYILQRLLTSNIEFNLPPTFVNHMINEAIAFYTELQGIQKQNAINDIEEIIKLHQLWLPDASGHASSIATLLDPTEMLDINEAKKFANDFNDLSIKINELSKMYERTDAINDALKYLNEQVRMKIADFIYFLSRIRELTIHSKILGVVKPLYPDHMIREEQYYLSSLQHLNI